MSDQNYNEMKKNNIKHVPTAEQKINYLYGLMSQEEKLQFETYLEQSPELSSEIQETKQLLEAMQEPPEIEAPEPPLFFADQKREKVLKGWVFSKFTQVAATLAACIALLMIIGALTRLEIGLNQDGFFCTFWNQPGSATGRSTAIKLDHGEPAGAA